MVWYSTLPSSLPTLAHSLPPPYAQAARSIIGPCSYCPQSLQIINDIITGVDSGLCFPPTTTSSALCTVRCPPPSPVFLLQKTRDCPANPANHCSSLKNLKLVLAPLPSRSSYSRGPAILCLIGVPRAGNLPDGRRSEGTRRRSS